MTQPGRKLIWVVLVIMGLMVCWGVGFAAGEVKTVPSGSWVYQELNQLYQDHLFSNYPYDWVSSGNELSRFEIAYYIKQIITDQNEHNETISAKSLVSLQKLIAEFQGELGDLGLKITDIKKISPNFIKPENGSDGFQDLDQYLLQGKESGKNESYYYLGQYYYNFNRKSFLFVPVEAINPGQLSLFAEGVDGFSIVYQPKMVKMSPFLVVKGILPISGKESRSGYFLYPIDSSVATGANNHPAINSTVLGLLEEVNQLQQVDTLWKFNGSLPLDGYLKLEEDFPSKQMLGNLNQGLKIGSFLVYSTSPPSKREIDLANFGLPIYGSHQLNTLVDLDSINGKYLQSMSINLQGTLTLNPKTSLYGGFDFLYRNSGINLDSWPSDTKASAGLQYHVSDDWTILTYQSLVNAQQKAGLSSTTSLGVGYNDWLVLWLAYQLLSFNDPVITGAVSIRF